MCGDVGEAYWCDRMAAGDVFFLRFIFANRPKFVTLSSFQATTELQAKEAEQEATTTTTITGKYTCIDRLTTLSTILQHQLGSARTPFCRPVAPKFKVL